MILHYSMKLGAECNNNSLKTNKVGLHINAGKAKLVQIAVLKAKKSIQGGEIESAK